MRPSLTPELLASLIVYDPTSGALVWNERWPELFLCSTQCPRHACKIWNSANAGKPALAAVNANGYRHGAVFGQTITAHKAAWAIYYGDWPVHGIDHINGAKTDNRIANLRDVPGAENAKNQKRNRRNTSGFTGIHFSKKTNKWVASIKGDGRLINLGYFATIEEAKFSRKEAELRFGFHQNHGRVA